MADIATRVAELADAVTQVAIGVLTLMAALVVLIGVANAVRSRRHEQVVIADIEPLTVAGTDRQAPTASLSLPGCGSGSARHCSPSGTTPGTSSTVSSAGTSPSVGCRSI